MNKILPNNIYKHLMKKTSSGYTNFDTWGKSKNASVFYAIEELYSKGCMVVSINGLMYAIKYKKGGGCGMGQYPDSYTLKAINEIGVIKGEDNE